VLGIVVPSIVKKVVYEEGGESYFPQVLLPDGTLWRGPSLGTNLTEKELDHQYEILKLGVFEHDLDPEALGWTCLSPSDPFP